MAVSVNEDQLVADYNSGIGMIDLGNKFGINKLTVRKILVKNGVTIRSKGRPSGAKNRTKVTEPVSVPVPEPISVPEPELEPAVPTPSPYQILD